MRHFCAAHSFMRNVRNSDRAAGASGFHSCACVNLFETSAAGLTMWSTNKRKKDCEVFMHKHDGLSRFNVRVDYLQVLQQIPRICLHSHQEQKVQNSSVLLARS